MSTKNKIINPGGVNGTGEGVVNVNSKDFKALQKAVIEHSKQQILGEKLKYALISVQFQMKRYASIKEPKNIIHAGEFLKMYLKAIGVNNKSFANFIEIKESNLSAIMKNKRKISLDLAYKLGYTFNSNPNLWLLIQSKNELLKINQEKKSSYQKYNLEKLLKKVS